MTCEVSLSEWDGDSPKVFRSFVVTARVPHKCYECDAAITPGQQYERVNGLWDKWETYTFCLACAEISIEFSESGRVFGILWDDMRNNWDEGYANIQACMNRVSTVAAKQKLLDRWRKWKHL